MYRKICGNCEMKLLYLTENNLRDRLFIQDLVNNYKLDEKAVLIHDTFGESVKDTRFVTKRLSALFSEAMVYNSAFSADQRDFIKKENGQVGVNTELISQTLYPIQLLIIGPVLKIDGKIALGDPFEMLQATRVALEIEEITLFTENPLSPLGRKKPGIDGTEELERLLKIYDEEANVINIAYSLRPARIASPQDYR